MRSAFLFTFVAAVSLGLISCSSENSAPVASTYEMGARAQVGPLGYTVFERQWLTQLGEPGPEARVPQNRFFTLRLSALNGGGADTSIPTLTLVDDSGKSYDEVTNGEGVSQWLGALRLVHPAEAVSGNILFDVPPQHYKLKVTDEEGKAVAYVDIPLSFDSSAPELPPVPDSAKKK